MATSPTWMDFRKRILPSLLRLIEESVKFPRGQWNWTMDPDCKYINIRIATRDGKAIVTNNQNEVFDLESFATERLDVESPYSTLFSKYDIYQNPMYNIIYKSNGIEVTVLEELSAHDADRICRQLNKIFRLHPSSPAIPIPPEGN